MSPLTWPEHRGLSVPSWHVVSGGGLKRNALFVLCLLYYSLICRLFLKMSAQWPDFFCVSDECQLQYLFTDKVFHSSICVCAYQQLRRALYVWCVKGSDSDVPKLFFVAVMSKEQGCVYTCFDIVWLCLTRMEVYYICSFALNMLLLSFFLVFVLLCKPMWAEHLLVHNTLKNKLLYLAAPVMGIQLLVFEIPCHSKWIILTL